MYSRRHKSWGEGHASYQNDHFLVSTTCFCKKVSLCFITSIFSSFINRLFTLVTLTYLVKSYKNPSALFLGKNKTKQKELYLLKKYFKTKSMILWHDELSIHIPKLNSGLINNLFFWSISFLQYIFTYFFEP